MIRAPEQGQNRESGTDEVIYVGCYVYNEEEDLSYFILYDGETNEQVCRLKMPSRVPFGFHGQYFSGDEIQAHFKYHEALDSDSDQCPMQWIRFFIKDYIDSYCLVGK